MREGGGVVGERGKGERGGGDDGVYRGSPGYTIRTLLTQRHDPGSWFASLLARIQKVDGEKKKNLSSIFRRLRLPFCFIYIYLIFILFCFLVLFPPPPETTRVHTPAREVTQIDITTPSAHGSIAERMHAPEHVCVCVCVA